MSTKLTETGRRPLRKYGTELRELAIAIVNRLEEMREEEDTGGDMIGVVENSIWNALFGYDATIPVDKRIAGLQRDLAEMEPLLRADMNYHGMCTCASSAGPSTIRCAATPIPRATTTTTGSGHCSTASTPTGRPRHDL